MKEVNDKERLMRFRLIDENNCWNWTGRTYEGYGIINVSIGKSKVRRQKVHRYALFIFKGINPSNNQIVLHKCHNRRCFNPDHLELGTNLDNAKDRSEDWKKFQNENPDLIKELDNIKGKIRKKYFEKRNNV
jgi:hypothetical protein